MINYLFRPFLQQWIKFKNKSEEKSDSFKESLKIKEEEMTGQF